jgi:REP element-mobilizing transposase RayT
MVTYYERRLPHWHPPGQDIFITWRLHGSLPSQVRLPAEAGSSGKAFVRYDRALDEARTGPLWLKDPRIAEAILSALREAQRRGLFALRAYAVMANHVHVLLAPSSPLERIRQQIKGASAREANLIPGRTGEPFWQKESFDHWVRNPGEWQKIRAYIERNPVAAGLVPTPEDWPWSSASNPIT